MIKFQRLMRVHLTIILILLYNLTKGNLLLVGGVSIIALGDFVQLSPVMGRASIQPPKSSGCNCRGGNLCVQLFEIYESTEIVRQNNDPEFGQVLNKFRESSHTDDDIRETKSLVDTGTSH